MNCLLMLFASKERTHWFKNKIFSLSLSKEWVGILIYIPLFPSIFWKSHFQEPDFSAYILEPRKSAQVLEHRDSIQVLLPIWVYLNTPAFLNWKYIVYTVQCIIDSMPNVLHEFLSCSYVGFILTYNELFKFCIHANKVSTSI